MEEFVLYVGHDKQDTNRFCVGSRQILEVIDAAPQLAPRILVQSVEVLKRSVQDWPDWLDGTPVLLCRETHTVRKGRKALEHVSQLAQERNSSLQAHPMMASGVEFLDSDDVAASSVTYTDDRKVSEADIEALIARRKAAEV